MESANGMAATQSQDLGSSQSQPVNSSQPVSNAPAPDTREERTFRQSEVNEIVKRAKNDAVETFRRVQTEQPHYAEQKYGVNQSVQQQFSSTHEGSQDIKQLVAEEARKQIDEIRNESYRQSQEEASKKTVQNFWNKVLPGKEKYQDFDKVVGDIDFQRFPNVVQLLGDYIDNSDAVLYELGKDRIKMANLEQLANMSPRDAIVQAQRLAQSIKDNESASKVRLPNEPLSQMRPTNAGTDNGAMTVSDYRKKYRV